jgi:hypothetical protein
MAQAANLSLLNGAGAAVLYNPQKVVTGEEAVYQDRTNAAIAAQSRASIRIRETKSARRVSGRLTVPILNATTGELSHELVGEFYLLRPLIATATESEDLRKRVVALVGHAVITSMINDGESVW